MVNLDTVDRIDEPVPSKGIFAALASLEHFITVIARKSPIDTFW